MNEHKGTCRDIGNGGGETGEEGGDETPRWYVWVSKLTQERRSVRNAVGGVAMRKRDR